MCPYYLKMIVQHNCGFEHHHHHLNRSASFGWSEIVGHAVVVAVVVGDAGGAAM